MSKLKIILNGIITENPTFVLMLGMCPTLGTTTSAINGMSMGLATMFVLMCSNMTISAVRNLIPDKVQYVLCAGHTVVGKLHDERNRLAFEQGAF